MGATIKEFTWGEISTHNSRDDCWIVVDGVVYDLSGWINSHPGGELLAVLAGEDATAMLHSCHLRDIVPMLAKFRIGEVAGYRADFAVYNDAFLAVLKDRVHRFFADRNINYRDTSKNRMTIGFTAMLLLACWACMYLLPPWGLLAAIPMGLATCSLIGSFGHEQIHGNLYSPSARKGIAHHLGNDLGWGLLIPFMPECFFQYEHIKHHLYPMSPTKDYDVFALRNFVRLSPDIKARKYQSLQHIYAPLVYGFYIFLQIIGGYTTSFFHKRNLLKDKVVLLNYVGMTLVAIVFHVAIPIYLTDAWWVLLCTGVYFFTWQAAIYLTSGAPHMTDTDAVTHKASSWSMYVCRVTRNLKCGDRFWDWLTGGLNYHLVHHLLPSIPREHLPKVRHIVEQTCKEFGYPYFTYADFRSYLRDHYAYLRTLGSARAPVKPASRRV